MLPASNPYRKVLYEAAKYIGTPYSEMDCSKFIRTAYRDAGISASVYPQSNSNAQQVLAMAESMLSTMDPTSPKYQAVRNAADYLKILLGSENVEQAEILSAMEALTRAMGGVY